jgi:hypothetical protein
MPRRPSFTHRWLTAATWPLGITLTSWDYMWRTTVMHRSQVTEHDPTPHLPAAYPSGVDASEVQAVGDGVGPLFHRRYSAPIKDATVGPDELMTRVKRDLNAAAPTRFARFERVLGDGEQLDVGDEYVVRMPGPWDGPVRVIAQTPRRFRLATLDGHLEAGQIEFRASAAESPDAEDMLQFTIESWAQSGDRFSNLLYHRIGMSKEVQLHMWISFLEGAAKLAGGRIGGGGIEIDTHLVDLPGSP